MKKAFPAIRPYHTQSIAVTPPHMLHVEESGNPDGIPVLFVHGGPGGGTRATDRCFFDPDKYRIVLFDQRGSGQSTPHALLENNNTTALIADIEVIRKTLEIDRWVVFGGSWGSTLSLVYAQTYPDLVMGLILRGIFLCRDQDIAWFYQHGVEHVFPDYWKDYIQVIPEEERDDLLGAFYRRLTGDNELERMAAAKAWSIWEGRAANLLQLDTTVDHFSSPHTAMSVARLETHYFVNQAFLEPNQLLRDVGKLSDIPGHIIHGRYDMICPLEQAHALHEAWPSSNLTIVGDAGHAASEPGIQAALVKVTDFMADELE